MRPAAAAAALLFAAGAASGAGLVIQNTNAAGQGFDDPTPATPVGLNYGTTRGAQAIIAFQYAAAVWGATLKSPVPIVIDAAFLTPAQDADIVCSATQGLLGYTRPVSYEQGGTLPNPQAGYVVALANALAGEDLTPGQPHIRVRFNAGIGTASCLPGLSWYYGLDGAAPAGQLALLATLLHEFAHGLGFTSFVDTATGATNGPPAAFDFHVFDALGNTDWATDSAAQRTPLLVGNGALAFQGTSVAAGIPAFLADSPALDFASSAGTTQAAFQAGEFSGPIPDGGARAVAAGAPLDACSALPPGSLAGAYGLLERGSCTFYEKAQRAVAAGAAGVIIYDNDAGPLITMATPDGGPALAVPAVFITNQDGDGLLGRLDGGAVTGSFGFSAHLSNTDASQTRVLLYTPPAVLSGSTLSHWNSNSYPRPLLMEPFLGATAQADLDLTPAALADLGWPVVAGLSVGMSKAQDATLADGAEATYLVAVFNRRGAAVAGVALDLAVPAGASFVSASGGCAALPCALGTLAAGEVRGVTVSVRAPSPAAFPFVVTARLTANDTGSADNLTASVSANKSPAASPGGGGCSAGGLPGALVLLLAAAAALRARTARTPPAQ